MGQFKPMVKMETTEPSVILRLKKGGHVNMKNSKGEHDHKPMNRMAMGGMMPDAAIPTLGPIARAMAAKRRPMPRTVAAPPPMPAPSTGGMMRPMKKGGKFEGSAKDEAQDAKLAKKHGMSKKSWESSKMDDKHDRQESMKGLKKGGSTGVKLARPAGYATGGTVSDSVAKQFKNTKVVDGDKLDTASGTGGVRMSNAGGFKDGGKAMKKYAMGGYAMGGSVGWENRPANGTPPGKTNTTTGEVKDSNAGGYRKGGAVKKHFATGGSVSTGRAVAMPEGRKAPSAPVSIDRLSGTFKKGGRVMRKANGGDIEDLSKGAYDATMNEPPMGMGFAKKAQGMIDSLFSSKKEAGAGRGFVNPKSITKMKESVTVAPMKKGGSAKC